MHGDAMDAGGWAGARGIVAPARVRPGVA
jgi:hypothetical protein